MDTEQLDSQAGHESGEATLPEMGLMRRVMLTFVSPSEVGDQIRENPTWFSIALIGLALTVTSILVIPADIFLEAMRPPPGSEAEMPAFMSGDFFKWIAVGSLTVFYFIVMAIMAGLVTVVFAFVMGDEGRFKQYFSALCHTSVISGLGALVVAPVRIASGDPQTTLSIGTFLRPLMEDGYLLRFTSMMDFFALWSWVVLGIFVSRIDPRRSSGSAIGISIFLVLGMFSVFAIFNPGG